MFRLKRSVVLWLIAFGLALGPLSLAPTVGAFDTSNYTQIFGTRSSWYQYKGIKDYVSAQDPYIANHLTQGWAANPNGMIDSATSTLFESGNLKAWNSSTNSWKLVPYYSYYLSSSNVFFQNFRWDLGPLTPATYYNYQIEPTNEAQHYAATFCNASYCVVMADILFSGVSIFNDVRSGGEAPCPHCALGYINTTQHQFFDTGTSTWYSYCYTYAWSYNADGTNPSQCRPGIDPPNWSINYH